MHLHQVTTRVRVGSDHTITLDAAQMARRSPRVTHERGALDGERFVVTPTEGLDFKVGEVIGIEPAKAIAHCFARLRGQDPEADAEDDQREARIGALVDACATVLDRRNPGDLTSNGTPAISALKEIVGFQVSAEERDVALERLGEAPSTSEDLDQAETV